MKPEQFIVDLYECRAKLIKPMRLGEPQDAHEVFQYNWLNVLIANLSDKYKVNYRDIEEEMRKRSFNKSLTE